MGSSKNARIEAKRLAYQEIDGNRSAWEAEKNACIQAERLAGLKAERAARDIVGMINAWEVRKMHVLRLKDWLV